MVLRPNSIGVSSERAGSSSRSRCFPGDSPRFRWIRNHPGLVAEAAAGGTAPASPRRPRPPHRWRRQSTIPGACALPPCSVLGRFRPAQWTTSTRHTRGRSNIPSSDLRADRAGDRRDPTRPDPTRGEPPLPSTGRHDKRASRVESSQAVPRCRIRVPRLVPCPSRPRPAPPRIQSAPFRSRPDPTSKELIDRDGESPDMSATSDFARQFFADFIASRIKAWGLDDARTSSRRRAVTDSTGRRPGAPGQQAGSETHPSHPRPDGRLD